MNITRKEVRFAWRCSLLLAFGLFVACDTTVTNPGPITDRALDDPGAHAGLVAGMNMSLARAVSIIADYGAVVSQEYTADGSSANWGYDLDLQMGILTENSRSQPWNFGQRARWVAEDGVRRLRDVKGETQFASSELGARALLYVGFANRLLGENMCEAVIDGGPREPRTVFFERATGAFSEAMEIADRIGDAEISNAARAGRAAARMQLGDWSGAVADADLVPGGFSFAVHFDDVAEWQWNTIFHRSAGSPFRNNTVWGTYYEDYYEDFGDPRAAWELDPAFPETSVSRLPFLRQLKYTSRAAPINLASGREMRLIIAEGTLRDGDWEDALEIINALRADFGVVPWTASTSEETWTRLTRERGIELWIEGRRLADLRRWLDESSPGEMEDMEGRSLCWPVHQNEIDTNPNVEPVG